MKINEKNLEMVMNKIVMRKTSLFKFIFCKKKILVYAVPHIKCIALRIKKKLGQFIM